MNKMRTLIAAGFLSAALIPVQAMADSPFDGTWKAELSSANFSKKPDVYLLKDGTYACKTCTPPYTIKADGSDQAVSGHPNFDTVAIKVVDDHTVQETDKKGGKTVGTSTTTVAADGKMADVSWTDSSSTSGQPVAGKISVKQVAAGPAGSNAISGSWVTTSVASISDNGITVTYKTDGDTLSMTNPTGESFTAKIDGTQAPFSGSPNFNTIAVKKVDARTLVLTYGRDGKVVSIRHMTVNKDGKTMSVSSHSLLDGHTTTWTNEKI
jgi:hypothetical protein